MKRPLVLFAGAALCSVVLTSCPKSVKTITRLQHMEEGVKNPTSIEELQDAIRKYQERVVDIQTATTQTGVWYKMLGTRYLDQKMYGKALECFRQAVEIYPDNQNLYYYIGVCAGFMAHTDLDYNGTGKKTFGGNSNYLKLSEDAYLRAVAIEPRYVRALYGLGVLYVHELDEPEKAIPHLEKLLTIDTKNINAMIVLAHAYHLSADYDNAVKLYDKIAATSKVEETRQNALDQKRQALEESYR